MLQFEQWLEVAILRSLFIYLKKVFDLGEADAMLDGPKMSINNWL